MSANGESGIPKPLDYPCNLISLYLFIFLLVAFICLLRWFSKLESNMISKWEMGLLHNGASHCLSAYVSGKVESYD